MFPQNKHEKPSYIQDMSRQQLKLILAAAKCLRK